MRLSIWIMLAGLLAGQGNVPANLVVWQSRSQGGSMEGSVTTFAVYAKGNTVSPVAEKQLGDDWCHFWPSGSFTCDKAPSKIGDIESFSLSAGNYELRSYVEDCNGNCGHLREAQIECRKTFSIKAGKTLYIRRDPTGTGCTLTSTPTRLQVLGAADLAGTILRSDGDPAVAVRIAAIRLDGNPLFQGALTDIDGHYLLQNVPEGDYYLAVLQEKQKTFYPGVNAQATAAVVSVRSRQGTGRYDLSIPAR